MSQLAKRAGGFWAGGLGRLAWAGVLIATAMVLETGMVLETASAEGPAIVITPGQERAFRAAVQTFREEDGLSVNPERARNLRTVIEEGLSYSGVLQPVPEDAFLGESSTTELGDKRFDCGDWTQSGADALVEGRIFRQGQETAVEYQVWDTARCTRVGQSVVAEAPKDETRLGKRISDGIVEAFTGTPGVASTELAFISDRSGAREVWVMDANGDRQRQATRGSSLKQFPDWMPDGGAILYTSYPERSGLPRLYLTSRGEYRPGPLLTRVLPDAPKYRGVFGPQGRYLALVTSIGGQAELFRVDRSGRDLHRLTRSSAIEISPSWSPDGRQIAFVSDRSGAPQIYIMDRDGGNVRRITYNGSYNTSPAWSPDGRWIAYETRVEAQFDLWLIDPAGEVNLPIVSHGRSDESPAWSPDSRKIAFSSTRRGRPDIYVVDADGKNLKRLTRGQGQNLQPAWGPFAR